MDPIRVGFIGLGIDVGIGKPGAWGASTHLPSLLASPHYQIVAVANSSIESAQASINVHKLGTSVKAYGNPSDIANDPDVDLVLVSVNVDQHYKLIKPALEAEKMVFVEWPLAANIAQVEELVELANSKKLKTMVGVQAQGDPLVAKIKQLIAEGRIGKVLSSNVTGEMLGWADVWPESFASYHDINSGANSLSVSYGHFVDSFTHVLGGFSSFNSILKADEAEVNIVSPNGSHYRVRKTAPNEIFLQGILQSGAVVSVNFRNVPFGNKTIDDKGVRWTITGTEGEIEITTPEVFWQLGPPGRTLKLRNKSGVVQDIDFHDAEEKAHVSGAEFPGTNAARLWEAFANGATDRYSDFENALETHRLLEAIRVEGKK